MTDCTSRALGAVALVTSLTIGGLTFAAGTSSPASAAAPRICLPGSLKVTLSKIRNKFGKPVVLSTHRPGATIRGSGKRSFHASCRAIDFRPPSGKYRAVLVWLKKNHNGGIGTYSGTHNHIHIDNGPRTRWHKSY